jgi:hypothetical protein
MEQCEGKVGGICPRPATWKQIVHAGHREAGRFLMHSYWCDEHADNIIAKRRREWQAPPQMVRLHVEAVEAP